MIRRFAQKGKPMLLLVSLLALAGLCGCGRTVTTQVASSSCGAVNVRPTTQPTPSAGISVQGPGHVESIVASGDVAYVGSDDGSIYAFPGAGCTPLWQHHLFFQQAGVYAAGGGMVYVSNAIQPAPVYALSAATGKVVWQFSQPGAVGFRMMVHDGLVFASAELADHRVRPHRAPGQQWTGPVAGCSVPGTATAGALGYTTWRRYIRQVTGQDPVFPAISTISALDAGSGRVLWTATLPGGDGAASSSPVESNGVLYVETSRGAVYALRASSGMQLWHIAGPQGAVPGSPYTILSPVVANDLVYAGGYQGVVAYRASDGGMVWRYQTTSQGPFPSSPVLASGVIFVGTGVGEFGDAVALRASDGTVLWKRPDAATSNFGPMFCEDGLIINYGNAGPVSALRTSDGSRVWQSPYMPEGSWYTSFGAPEALGTGAGGSDVLYVGSADGVVHALRVSDGIQLWHYAVA